MNEDRRRRITSIIDKLNELAKLRDSLEANYQELIDEANDKWSNILNDYASLQSSARSLHEEIESIKSEEEEAYENMPESLQSSDKGDAAQSVIDELDSAMSNLDDISNENLDQDIEIPTMDLDPLDKAFFDLERARDG